MKKTHKLLILLIIELVFIKGAFFSFFGLNFFDDGESLHNGMRILEGGRIYKDIWTFFPPADIYFPALMLKISNSYMWTFRLAESLMYALLIGIVTYILINYLRIRKSFIILTLITLTFINVYSNLFFYHLFFFLSLFLVCVALYRNIYNPLFIYISGLLIGIAFLFRHDVGLIGSVAISISLLLVTILDSKTKASKIITRSTVFFLGVLTVVLPVVIWLINEKVINEFLYLAFVKAPQISRILSPGFLVINDISQGLSLRSLMLLSTIFFYVIYLVVHVFIFFKIFKWLKEKKKLIKEKFIIITISLYGLLQIPYAFSVIDIGHLSKAGFPTIILGIYLINQLRVKSALVLIYLTPLILFILTNLIFSFWWIKYNDTKVNLRYGSVFINSIKAENSTHPTADTLKKTLEFINSNTREGEYIFATPYHAMIYFLSDRKDPSRFNNFAAGFVSRDEQDEVINSIRDKNAKIVVYDPINAPLGKTLKDYSPKIHQFIIDNYQTIETTNQGWLLMRRK